mmetsp:Transcript_30094/g.89485  ORF Transcript_30094/g.89485 Transcript_30094/m.89485 type:complete len:206 (+) Transcript_30094:280-897(+)
MRITKARATNRTILNSSFFHASPTNTCRAREKSFPNHGRSERDGGDDDSPRRRFPRASVRAAAAAIPLLRRVRAIHPPLILLRRAPAAHAQGAVRVRLRRLGHEPPHDRDVPVPAPSAVQNVARDRDGVALDFHFPLPLPLNGGGGGAPAPPPGRRLAAVPYLIDDHRVAVARPERVELRRVVPPPRRQSHGHDEIVRAERPPVT